MADDGPSQSEPGCLIPLYRGSTSRTHQIIGYARIDGERAEALSSHKWAGLHGYAIRTVLNEKGTRCLRTMHHEVFGSPGAGLEIDHINRDKSDNRASNLRAVTHSQNQLNKLGTHSYISRRSDRVRQWCAKSRLNGGFVWIGSFAAEGEARAAVAAFRLRHGLQVMEGQ